MRTLPVEGLECDAAWLNSLRMGLMGQARNMSRRGSASGSCTPGASRRASTGRRLSACPEGPRNLFSDTCPNLDPVGASLPTEIGPPRLHVWDLRYPYDCFPCSKQLPVGVAALYSLESFCNGATNLVRLLHSKPQVTTTGAGSSRANDGTGGSALSQIPASRVYRDDTARPSRTPRPRKRRSTWESASE